MLRFISHISLVVLMAVVALPALAQSMYYQSEQDRTQVLRAPAGSYDSQQSSQRPLFQSGYAAPVQPQMVAPSAPATVAPSRMLPPEMAGGQQPVAAMPYVAPATGANGSYTMQNTRSGVGTATVNAPTVTQRTNVTTSEGAGTVQLRGACDNKLNHRNRNKGLGTATTVMNDCLD